MKTLKLQTSWLAVLFASLLTSAAYGQITPSGDSYTNTADSTTNYGSKTVLDVDGASQVTFIQFNLASIPSTATISQATLKLYVNSVTTAGSFNVDYVNGTWTESAIDASNAPALGTTIASGVSITTTDKNQYILIDVTAAVQAWLSGSETNNGIALVANSTFNASFDSKENTTTSHPAELDIAYAGGDGTITGVTTASGSGLTGGGTSGTLNLSLTNACSTGQILQWNGSAWACSSAGTGTITGVTAGTGLGGGGTSGNVTLTNAGLLGLTAGSGIAVGSGQAPTVSVSGVPLLAASNNFTGPDNFVGPVGIGTTSPFVTLDVHGNVATNSVFSFSNVQQFSSPFGVYISAPASETLGFFTNALQQMTVTGAGYVGIGTTSPTAALDVVTGDEVAGNFQDDAADVATLSAFNAAPTNDIAWVLSAEGNAGYCEVDISGNLYCTGSKSAVVPVDGGSRNVALYAVEAPENWFEDFGSGQLSNGLARIGLEPIFVQTVNTDLDYHVFLTPNGDCNGLYVSQKSPTSFEVHELAGGTSSVAFDYRIIAKRKKYETVRLADLTERYKKLDEHLARMRQRGHAAAPATSNRASALEEKPGINPAIQKQARLTQSAAVPHSITK